MVRCPAPTVTRGPTRHTACALANQNGHVDDPPRMVDFAKWITAAEPAIGLPKGTLLQAYRDNLARGTGIVLDQSTHIAPLLEFMESQAFDPATQTHTWQGTTRELLNGLRNTNAAREARTRRLQHGPDAHQTRHSANASHESGQGRWPPHRQEQIQTRQQRRRKST